MLDRNRDNRISSSEWYCAPEYFRRADRDRNGSLSAAEFTGQAAPVWDDDRDDSFENLDVNNNGRIEAGGMARQPRTRSSGWTAIGTTG